MEMGQDNNLVLRYSLVPSEKMLCNDSRNKYLDEQVFRERDCMLAHGTSRFLKERLFEKSDPYVICICEICGNIATSPTYCKVCDTDKISKVNLPFASKLLVNELNSMSIKTLIGIKK